MRPDAELIPQLLEWARHDDNIRAMWLWGSRADPQREPDEFSDYDIGILARQSGPFAADESWITQFGSIMIRWPARPAPTFSPRWLTQLVLFEDGLRIDFQITEAPFSLEETQPEPYRVLLDKDGVAEAAFARTTLPPWITLPDEAAYTARVMSFWWDIVYVPKALVRDELNFAKFMLDANIRPTKLEPFMQWYVGATVGTRVNLGIHGRWFKRYLPDELWKRYELTFAAASIEDNWRAVFAAIAFAREVSSEVAKRLGFRYPRRTDALVTGYIERIREKKPV